MNTDDIQRLKNRATYYGLEKTKDFENIGYNNGTISGVYNNRDAPVVNNMLTYKLIANTNDVADYEYCPEDNKNSVGIVRISKSNGKVSVIKLSPSDEFKTYAMKLFKKLREFNAKSEYKQSGTITWY